MDPTANPGSSGGGIWGPGGVSIDAAQLGVFTATGNGFPNETDGSADRIVRLDLGLAPKASNYVPLNGTDADYGSTPVLFQPTGCPRLLAVKNKAGLLVVENPDDLTHGPRQTVQVGTQWGETFIGDVAWSPVDQMLFVANSSNSDDRTYHPGMVAFSVNASCMLQTAWQQPFGIANLPTSPITVANGVVYEGDGFGNTLRAFATRTGALLWSSGATGHGVFGAPTVVRGAVYVTTWDGQLIAYGP